MLTIRQGGFSLIEGMVSVLIFSLGILGLIGLQASMTQSTVMAKARIDASFLASQKVAAVWGDVANIPMMTGTTENISHQLPEGQRVTTFQKQDDAYEVKVRVSWKLPGDSAVQSYTTVTRVAGN